MDIIKATTQVRKISYVCHKSGDVEPYVHIDPLVDPSGNCIGRFPLFSMDCRIDPVLGLPTKGDIISITVAPHSTVKPALRIETPSPLPRKSVHTPTYCPICGDALHSTDHALSLGRCWNRNCPGLFNFNMVHYLSHIGVPLNPNVIRVIRCIAGRGSIYSLFGLYQLGITDLDFVYLTMPDIQYFLTVLHNLRGKVKPITLLHALRIPEWTAADYLAMGDFCDKDGVKLMDLPGLIPQGMEFPLEPLKLQILRDFFAHATNYELLCQLSFVLTQ